MRDRPTKFNAYFYPFILAVMIVLQFISSPFDNYNNLIFLNYEEYFQRIIAMLSLIAGMLAVIVSSVNTSKIIFKNKTAKETLYALPKVVKDFFKNDK